MFYYLLEKMQSQKYVKNCPLVLAINGEKMPLGTTYENSYYILVDNETKHFVRF